MSVSQCGIQRTTPSQIFEGRFDRGIQRTTPSQIFEGRFDRGIQRTTPSQIFEGRFDRGIQRTTPSQIFEGRFDRGIQPIKKVRILIKNDLHSPFWKIGNSEWNHFVDENSEWNHFVDENSEWNHFVDENSEWNHFVDENSINKYDGLYWLVNNYDKLFSVYSDFNINICDGCGFIFHNKNELVNHIKICNEFWDLDIDFTIDDSTVNTNIDQNLVTSSKNHSRLRKLAKIIRLVKN
ncbi:putative orfan [Tupanvirus soda lake]|uniref:Orfan n=2 Tax=Tupanvirus TaxID=2094720 RepID=A0AC62AD84_9VIRU|nr:putative orfan [Tupanvirus soda lake]QKU35752.1 putative orfan [Tupanvirus soda lake]